MYAFPPTSLTVQIHNMGFPEGNIFGGKIFKIKYIFVDIDIYYMLFSYQTGYIM